MPGALEFGLVLAQAWFAATFRGPRERFWHRMTMTGLNLGGLALLTSRPARRTRIGPKEVALGLGSAARALRHVPVGDVFARRFVPGGDAQIRDIYTLRTIRPKEEIAARLATIIGPAEELFWRGLVQEALMARYGRWTGAALAASAYGGVHIVTGNFTLFGAAGIAGAHWCALYAAGVPARGAGRQPRDLGRLDLPHPADRRDRAGRAARCGRRRLSYRACGSTAARPGRPRRRRSRASPS